MAPVAMLALLVVLLPHTLAVCPSVSCAVLKPNVCGLQLAEDKFEINGDGCKDNYECRLTDFMDWIAIAKLSTLSFSCVPANTEVVNATTWVPGTCRTREFKKDFAAKQTRVLCSSDEDCLLEDGSWTSCICVPRSDAKGVCEPHPSNQALFYKYWTDCAMLKDMSMMQQAMYLYYEYVFQYWVYEQSDLPCIGNFAELKTLQDLRDNYEWAAVSAVAGLLFVF